MISKIVNHFLWVIVYCGFKIMHWIHYWSKEAVNLVALFISTALIIHCGIPDSMSFLVTQPSFVGGSKRTAGLVFHCTLLWVVLRDGPFPVTIFYSRAPKQHRNFTGLPALGSFLRVSLMSYQRTVFHVIELVECIDFKFYGTRTRWFEGSIRQKDSILIIYGYLMLLPIA